MAVKDIFGLQSSYNLNNTYNDQVNWQDAFKMANSFAETSEKHRANRENLATEDWRTVLANNMNQAQAEEQKYNFGKWQGTNQMMDFAAKNAYDPETGRFRSAEELMALYNQDPSQLKSPHAVVGLQGQAQQYLANMGKLLAPINPQMGSTYTSMATGSPFITDDKGNVMNVNSGETVANIANPEKLAQFAGGNMWEGFLNNLKAVQEAEKAKLVAEVRQPYTLEAIQARTDGAIKKQDNWQGYKTEATTARSVEKMVEDAFGSVVDIKKPEDAAKVAGVIETIRDNYKDDPEMLKIISRKTQILLNTLK
ncbi:hypothetical protein A1D22_05675 [Pasteurellaceae bacterium LFhippo2]|nr:hypothetical protein [Pasteurellaceae bacterium LFhippo2]